MSSINMNKITQYVEENIGVFHDKRIEGMEKLKLKTVLKKKNPYLFKAKNLSTSETIIKAITDAYISSREETIFGDWLEGLAIFINNGVYNGWKSGIKGVDLEFDRNNKRYICAIKSGPNWGNSSQVSKMIIDFTKAKKTLRTSNSKISVVAVNGCCYGIDKKPDKGEYFKYCGQRFWEFISGSSGLYQDIIEPLGNRAKERNDTFMNKYSNMINIFTKEFLIDFCRKNGEIDWEKLVKFNSGKND